MGFKPVRQGAGFARTLHPACEALFLAFLHQKSTIEPHLLPEVADYVHPWAQECKAGTCACKEGFSPCAARGGRCLDVASCPAGPGTDSAAADINTQGVGGMLGTIG